MDNNFATELSCYILFHASPLLPQEHWLSVLPLIQHAHDLAVIRTDGGPLPQDHFSDWVVFSSFQLWVSTKNPFAQQVPSPSPSPSPPPQRDRPWLTAPLSHSRRQSQDMCQAHFWLRRQLPVFGHTWTRPQITVEDRTSSSAKWRLQDFLWCNITGSDNGTENLKYFQG